MAGETTGLKNLPGRGGRLIVVHIGNEDRFLKDLNNPTKDARLIFQANKKTNLGGTDYHDEFTGACFEEWFQNVLSMLPANSVIVMDNASYHSKTVEKFPNMGWRKSDIQTYLTTSAMVPIRSKIRTAE